MPLRKVVLAMVALAFVAGVGCSRLTFVKPKFKRDFHQTGPEYTVRDDPRDVQRVAAIDQVALAEQGLRRGQLDDAEPPARAAIKADPTSPDASTMLAMVEEQRGSEDTAGQMYAKAMSLAPS